MASSRSSARSGNVEVKSGSELEQSRPFSGESGMFRFGAAVDLPADLLFKSLNWRLGSCAVNRIYYLNNQRGFFRYFGYRRQRHPSGSWFVHEVAPLIRTQHPGPTPVLPATSDTSVQR